MLVLNPIDPATKSGVDALDLGKFNAGIPWLVVVIHYIANKEVIQEAMLVLNGCMIVLNACILLMTDGI